MPFEVRENADQAGLNLHVAGRADLVDDRQGLQRAFAALQTDPHLLAVEFGYDVADLQLQLQRLAAGSTRRIR